MLYTDATSLPRFMQCNGNILLQADPVYSSPDMTIREEGNAAHWLASVAFTKQYTIEELIDRKAPNGVFITAEMAEHVSDYLSCVDRSPRQVNFMEWEYSINGQNWQINGRADHIAYVDDILSVDDFKYGYSIVEPEKNWTLISHAVGYCITKNIQPNWIVFTIHQPRAPHHNGRIRHWRIDYTTLLNLYAEMSATLSNPSNMLNTGPQCYKCSKFVSCPARQNAELNSIEVSHIAYNAEITNDDLAERMDQINRAMELLEQSKKAYKELATYRVSKGEVVPNYMMQDDLGNTTWKPWVTPELLDAISIKSICKLKLPTMKDAREVFNDESMKALTYRPHNGNKLVRVNANKKAKQMFGDKK